MLTFKPRLRSGTQVSTWKPFPESKNRGKVSNDGQCISLSTYNLTGVAYLATDNHIRLMSNTRNQAAGVTFTRLLYDSDMPITIECDFGQTFTRSDPADGIVINFSQFNGSYSLLGAIGGNIGFITATPTFGFGVDIWPNSGQVVPSFRIWDSRQGDAFRNASPFTALTVGEVSGRHFVKVVIDYTGVKMYNDNILKLDSLWSAIDGGGGIQASPWILSITSATGASNQISDLYSVKVNGCYWFYSGV